MVHLKKLCSSDKPCEPKICVYRLYKMRGCHTKTFCSVNRKSTISNKLGNNTTNYSSLPWFNYESWLFSVHLEWTKHLFSFCILTCNLKIQNKSWFVVIREEFRIELLNCSTRSIVLFSYNLPKSYYCVLCFFLIYIYCKY